MNDGIRTTKIQIPGEPRCPEDIAVLVEAIMRLCLMDARKVSDEAQRANYIVSALGTALVSWFANCNADPKNVKIFLDKQAEKYAEIKPAFDQALAEEHQKAMLRRFPPEGEA